MSLASKAGDETGKCSIFVHSSKKDYYRKFLSQPVTLESHLPSIITDKVFLEISRGAHTEQRLQSIFQETFLYQRIRDNPGYYGTKADLETFISQSIIDLQVRNLISDKLEAYE